MKSAQRDNSARQPKTGVSFAPAFLGAGVLFSVFLNAIRFFAEGGLPADPLYPFVVATGLGCCICGVAGALATLASKRAGRHMPDPVGSVPVAVGTVCAALGLLAVLPVYAGFPLIVPAPLLGVAFGAGFMLLATAWGTLFARLEPENLLFNSALAVMAAAVLHVIASFLSSSVAGLAFMACSLVSSCALLMVARTRTADAVSAQETTTFAQQPETSSERRDHLRKALAILWMPVVGACITCFIFGLTWDPIVSSEQTRLIDPLGPWKSLIGPVLIGIAVAAMAAREANSSPLRLLNQAVYPVAVALLLALPVIDASSVAVASVVDVLTQTSFGVIVLAIWCSMASAARRVPLSPALVFPACFALLALSFVGGLCGIAVIGTAGRTICLLILTVYLALIAVSFAQGNKSQKEGRTEPRSASSDSRNYIHRCCDKLAGEHGLSPREREVLYYLGRGYNHGYVAEKLYISENTVRTHVRHIYGKLDVGSREELLALIDATEDAR